MKQRKIEGIAPDRADEGYQFFIECIDEMLFDYTLDTYKPPVHNASTLAREVMETIEDIENSLIDESHLEHLIDELKWMISADPLAKRLIYVDYESVLSECSAKHLKATRAKVSLIASALSSDRYIDESKKEISAECRRGTNKKEIRAASRTLIASLLRQGYSRRYIRDRVTHYFHSTDQSDPIETRVNAFFGDFKQSPQPFKVAFAVPGMFKLLEKPCSDVGITVQAAPPDFLSAEHLARLSVAGGRAFLVVNEVSALDPYSARKRAEEVLSLVTDLYAVFHHTQPLSWSETAVVLGKDTNSTSLVGAPVRPMARVIDLYPKIAAQKLHVALNEFTLNHDALEQFHRVLGLHGAALRATTTSVQLLNLWSALEASTPTSMIGVRVRNVISTLVPFLMLSYPSGFYPDSADTFTKIHTGSKECPCPSASATALNTSTSWSNWSAGRSRAAGRLPWRSGSPRPC